MNKTRAEAFSDGVFTIVITILVLDLKLPGDVLNLETLASLWPRFSTFLLSFLLVGTYWVAHHSMWATIERVDRTLLWTNMLVLLLVILIPFAANLLAGHPTNALAIFVYGSVLALTNAAGCTVWLMAAKRKLMAESVSWRFIRRVTAMHAAPIPVYAIGISLHSLPSASLAVFALPPLAFSLASPLIDRYLGVARIEQLVHGSPRT